MMQILVYSLATFVTVAFGAPGDGDWAPAYAKASTALAKLTNADKVALASGIGWMKGPCVCTCQRRAGCNSDFDSYKN